MRIFTALALLLICATAGAWQVELTPTGGDIQVSNTSSLNRVDAYLVWADLQRPVEQWASWRLGGGWRDGLHPVADQAVELPPFSGADLGAPPRECPEGHACLLAMVAVSAGDSPLEVERWQAVSIHPLSATAARLRLPGQRLFLPADPGGDGPMPLATGMPESDATVTGDSTATTEKPDIFRLEGDRLLYANGPAERFQVIDISDPTAPRLEAWLRLQGAPREIYALNGYYVLMQGNQWGDDEGNRVTTLRLSDEGTLETVAELELNGNFVESRRRGGIIYAVTQEYSFNDNTTAVTVHALEVDTAGAISQSAEASFSGYGPEVAIFPDHLVITGHDSGDWRATNVQLYDLARTDTPLHPLSLLQVPGRIPSEFHLNVADGLLRLVYGPPTWEEGSTLAVYTIGSDALAFAGSAGPIAPGEQLFATRFVEDTAYVVTYERTDPLWVIDLTVPSAPAIVGELEVPGWSELLFFNDQRLFAVGIDDQPAEGENWAQRVAVSLFDVADPTDPRLLTRITPLVGEASYSHSPALSDERALLLDWNDGYAALPITSWDTTTQNRLQLIDIGPDSLSDGGHLSVTTAIQRSVELDVETLAALGDQALTTLTRGAGDPQPIGELELARNLSWIGAEADHAWVAGSGDGGYHHLYRYGLDDLETPTAQWALEQNLQQVTANGDDLLFYNSRPLTAQWFTNGVASPLLTLTEEDDNSWSSRTVLIAGERIYLGETHYGGYRPMEMLLPPIPESDALSTLRRWRVTDGNAVEAAELTIPGRLVAVDDGATLLTLETGGNNARLHHLALEESAARLIASDTLPCAWPNALWNPPVLYLSCTGNYWEGDGDTTLIRYSAADGEFQESGRWSLDGNSYLSAVSTDKVLVNQWSYIGLPEPMPLTDDVAVTTVIAPSESRCRVFDLSGPTAVELATPEDCYAQSAALAPDRLLQARGYAGLRETRW